jgi:membrane fusion protein, multidrug efflux system
LVQARKHFERLDTLMARGFTTRHQFDQAKEALQTALSRVDDAEAQLNAAHDLVGFTELKADAAGVVTATGPAAGAAVQAGQMIVKLARKDGRDALFDVPAQLIRSAPADPQIVVGLTNDPTVTATGRVREVAPQADPVTRTFEFSRCPPLEHVCRSRCDSLLSATRHPAAEQFLYSSGNRCQGRERA